MVKYLVFFRIASCAFLFISMIIGLTTGIVGLYRFRTVTTRVHVCSAALLWITWPVAIFGLLNAEDIWTRIAMLVYWLVQAWLLPLGSQAWITIERSTKHKTDRLQ